MNVDLSESVGNIISDLMAGVSVAKHKFTKKNQVNTLVSAVYVSVDGEKVEIDTKQLYQ